MTYVLTNLTVVDPFAKSLKEKSTVVLEGNRIQKVIHNDVVKQDAKGGAVVDCEGKFLLPGLMDMHTHLYEGKQSGDFLAQRREGFPTTFESLKKLVSKLHSYLYCGVTSIYDAGNVAPKLYYLRELERAGKIFSPRIFCAGWFVTCPGGHGSPLAVEISSLPADVQKLDNHLKERPDIVKITYDERNWATNPLIPILSKAVLKQIIDYCHSRNFRVTVHASNEFRSREAIECGADSLAHTVIQSPITEDFADLVSKRKVPLVTTLQIGESYPRLAEHPEYLNEPLYRDCISAEELEYLHSVESPKQSKSRHAAWMKVMTPVLQENINRIQRKGAKIVTGTDGSSGPDYIRELELLQEAGISPWDIIIAATRNGAIFLGREEELGLIKEGSLADLVIVDANPTTDIMNLRRVSMVVKNGQIVNLKKLDLPCNRGKA